MDKSQFKSIVSKVAQQEAKIKELKNTIHSFESCKIVSVRVRKFDNETCTFSEHDIDYHIPRKVLKAEYLKVLHNELKEARQKVEYYIAASEMDYPK